jgi:hypothetical protein
MRRIVVGAFLSLDGVMQSSGGPKGGSCRRLPARWLGRPPFRRDREELGE